MNQIAMELGLPQKGSQAEWESFKPVAEGLALGRIGPEWFGQISQMVREKISEDTAPVDILLNVRRHNPDSFWGLFRQSGESHDLIGFYGQLLLNSHGHRALLDGSLDRLDPQLELLCEYRERPDAIYIWCIVAKKMLATLQSALLNQLPHLSGMPYYTCLATQDSLSVGKQLGFMPVTQDDDRLGGLFKLPLVLPRMRSPRTDRIDVKVVATAGELEQARAVRAIAFVEQQACPYDEEFEGNDYSAQHLLGLVNGEPAATMRMRFFAGFVKWERYCVRERFRRTAVKDHLIGLAIDLVRRKGYSKIYFQAESSLENFWRKRGFAPLRSGAEIRFSDRAYQEFEMDVAPHGEAITLAAEPMVINRVEGSWDQPGILDRSAQRAKATSQ